MRTTVAVLEFIITLIIVVIWHTFIISLAAIVLLGAAIGSVIAAIMFKIEDAVFELEALIHSLVKEKGDNK